MEAQRNEKEGPKQKEGEIDAVEGWLRKERCAGTILPNIACRMYHSLFIYKDQQLIHPKFLIV
jgi:hypothetical protein